MGLAFHPLVQRDLRAVLRYYEEEGGVSLADRFYTELVGLIARIEESPERFHLAEPSLRRANLASFPYHRLFRETNGAVRVLVLRHRRRRPQHRAERR